MSFSGEKYATALSVASNNSMSRLFARAADLELERVPNPIGEPKSFRVTS